MRLGIVFKTERIVSKEIHILGSQRGGAPDIGYTISSLFNENSSAFGRISSSPVIAIQRISVFTDTE